MYRRYCTACSCTATWRTALQCEALLVELSLGHAFAVQVMSFYGINTRFC
jgi:hypothetical protein